MIINIAVKKVAKIKQNDQIENMDYIDSRLQDDQFNNADDGYGIQDEDSQQEFYYTEEPYESRNQGDQDFYFIEEPKVRENEGNSELINENEKNNIPVETQEADAKLKDNFSNSEKGDKTEGTDLSEKNIPKLENSQSEEVETVKNPSNLEEENKNQSSDNLIHSEDSVKSHEGENTQPSDNQQNVNTGEKENTKAIQNDNPITTEVKKQPASQQESITEKDENVKSTPQEDSDKNIQPSAQKDSIIGKDENSHISLKENLLSNKNMETTNNEDSQNKVTKEVESESGKPETNTQPKQNKQSEPVLEDSFSEPIHIDVTEPSNWCWQPCYCSNQKMNGPLRKMNLCWCWYPCWCWFYGPQILNDAGISVNLPTEYTIPPLPDKEVPSVSPMF